MAHFMIARLKASRLGKWLYRLSRRGTMEQAMIWLSRCGIIDALNPAHFKPDNRRHNAMQARRLDSFRSQHRKLLR